MLASGSNEKVRQVAGQRSRPRAESACELSASSVRSTFCRRSRARFGLCGGRSGRRETRCPQVTVGDWPGQNDAGFHLPVQPGAAAAGRRLATDRRSARARGLAGAARPLSPPLLLFDFHTCRFRDVSFWGCAGLTAKSGGKSRASTQSPALTQPPPPTSRTSPASVPRPADPCGHAAGPRMA